MRKLAMATALSAFVCGVMGMGIGNLAEKGLTFDDVLQAVQESSRGRWFLDEFQKRAKGDDGGKVLAAIAKIEARIEGMAEAASAAGELEKVRSAIASTRREIALQKPESSELSDEGRMFAKLAELARKTMPAHAANDHITNGVVRTLNLVDALDQSLNSSNHAPKPADTYFSADNDIFAPAPKASKPVLVSVAQIEPLVIAAETVPVGVEMLSKGARLVIHRTKPATAIPDIVASEETPSELSVDKPLQIVETAEIVSPRIIIVRRKPEEMQTLPLEAEAASESAA